MEHIYDIPFCNSFRCDGDIDFHDYYYINPSSVDKESLLYQVHRAGIEHQLPKVFEVMRDSSNRFVHIFCILSGSGYLEYENRVYILKPGQLLLLPAYEAHRYWCDPLDPIGKVWMEICGGDAERIARHLVQRHGPVIEGSLISSVSEQICLLQQKLMMDGHYQPSLEIYQVLLTIITGDKHTASQTRENCLANFVSVETYINAHLSQKITNAELAEISGISPHYFLKMFKESYGTTPQKYIMQQRLNKAQYALLHTKFSIETISASLGFYDAGHFIRRFSQEFGMPPAQYKKMFTLDNDQ